MTRVIYHDEGIGETRAVLFSDDRPVELWIERWSEIGKIARVGDRYWGRVTSFDARISAAFIDLGVGVPALLPLPRRTTALVEGSWLRVKVIREAVAEKGPVLKLEPPQEGDSRSRPRTGRAGLIDPGPSLLAEGSKAFFSRDWWDGCDVIADASSRLEVDAAVENALATQWVIPHGGRISLEPTKALVAIDVDAGPRSGKQQNAAKFCEDLNCAAAEVLARAVRLKGLGGLFAVDFAALTDVKTRAKVETVLKASLKVDPAETRCGTIDQFGVCIFQRQRKTRSVLELLLEPGQSGRDPAVLSVESRSLEAIRQLETQAYTDRGARLVLRVPNDVHAWLNADTIGWKTALAAKIGARFVVQPALSVGQRVDVEMQ